jgi:GT2 family glycosyltransferase
LNSASQFNSVNEFEWIIVDNDSRDNSREIITQQFPFVRWIDMHYNAGFARANNEGIRQSVSDIVLLLNPDTIIVEDAINECYQKFITTHYVACGVQMLNPDSSFQISGSNFMKGGLNHLLPLPYWGNFLRRIAFTMNTSKPSIEQAALEEKVDWISGAFLMVKKSAIEKAGLMDEDFFLYAEEVEWCSRLRKVGAICIFGNFHIIHILGEVITGAAKSTDKNYTNLFDKKGLQLIISNHVRIRKQYGIGWFLFQLFNYSFAVPLFFICSFFDNLFRLRFPFKDFNKVSGLAKNVAMLWKLTPTILRNKPHFYKVL